MAQMTQMTHAETLKTIRKLMLLTYVFLTAAFIIFGIVVLFIVLKLNQVSAHAINEYFDEMGWAAIVLLWTLVVGYVVTYAITPSVILRIFYTDTELREESLGKKSQMAQLEEYTNTLVTVMKQCYEIAERCSESALECGVSAGESRTATGKLENEVRGLAQATEKAYEIVGMLGEANGVLGAKVEELNAYTASLDKALVTLETNREKVLDEALQPVKNSLIALRKENVQLHKTLTDMIGSLEDADADLHDFMLELVHGISSAYRTHEDRKRVT